MSDKKKKKPPVNFTQDMMNDSVNAELSELRETAKHYAQLVETLTATVRNNTVGESALVLCKEVVSQGDPRPRLERIRKAIKSRMQTRLREL